MTGIRPQPTTSGSPHRPPKSWGWGAPHAGGGGGGVLAGLPNWGARLVVRATPPTWPAATSPSSLTPWLHRSSANRANRRLPLPVAYSQRSRRPRAPLSSFSPPLAAAPARAHPVSGPAAGYPRARPTSRRPCLPVHLRSPISRRRPRRLRHPSWPSSFSPPAAPALARFLDV
ncbi:hypothetical protein PVAP13_1NG293519 [Panicum virgatum]|uniref:Uncharacterized protein n=1 Tax=Panicum virgatum TaxID=38727 RepID=A0A8T0X7U7_PANVG|nr:hypothetical protein PVAP13_1NG293519 [Panicum virgatum]